MNMPSITAPLSREEQRAATRKALLDATLDSLIEVGYANTSTRAVAERAGVSQGALQHHFQTKAQLVDAAINHIVNRLAGQARADFSAEGTPRERAEMIVDLLWSVHKLPIAQAVFELFQVARTDREMAKKISATLNQGVDMVHRMIAGMVPELAAQPGFSDWLLMSEAKMRGTVMLSAIPGARRGFAPWPQVRADILKALDDLIRAWNPASPCP